jgi:hypothetical protein
VAHIFHYMNNLITLNMISVSMFHTFFYSCVLIQSSQEEYFIWEKLPHRMTLNGINENYIKMLVVEAGKKVRRMVNQ